MQKRINFSLYQRYIYYLILPLYVTLGYALHQSALLPRPLFSQTQSLFVTGNIPRTQIRPKTNLVPSLPSIALALQNC